MNVSESIEELQESAAQISTHIVNLIVIFVLQTIVLPLAFLWIFVEILKLLAVRSLSLISAPKGATET